MKAGVDTIRELKGELESGASELDKTGESEDVTQQLQKASESLTELQEVFITSGNDALTITHSTTQPPKYQTAGGCR